MLATAARYHHSHRLPCITSRNHRAAFFDLITQFGTTDLIIRIGSHASFGRGGGIARVPLTRPPTGRLDNKPPSHFTILDTPKQFFVD